MKRDFEGNIVVSKEPVAATPTEEPFLLSCPVEVLFLICQNFDDPEDLLCLSLASKSLRNRMRGFIRCCAPAPEIGSSVKPVRGFKFCPTTTFDQRLPDWCISLVTLEDCANTLQFVEGMMYLTQFSVGHSRKHFKVFIQIVPAPGLEDREEAVLTKLLIQPYALLEFFFLGPNYVLVIPDKALGISHNPNFATTVKAPQLNLLLLEHTDVTHTYPLRQAIPQTLAFKNSAESLFHRLPLHKLKHLVIQGPSPHPLENEEDLLQTIPVARQLRELKNLTLPNLEKLTAVDITRMENLSLPSLQLGEFRLYPREGDKYPVMKNVEFPETMDSLRLVTHDTFIVFEDCKFPKKCTQDFLYTPIGQMGCWIKPDDVGERIPVPKSKNVSVTNTLSRVSKETLGNLTEVVVKTWADLFLFTENAEETISLPKLRQLTLKDKSIDWEVVEAVSNIRGRVNFDAPRLQELKLEKHCYSKLLFDMAEISVRYPRLRDLFLIQSQYDTVLKDVYKSGTVFPKLDTLTLVKYPLADIVEFFSSLDLEKMKSLTTVIMDSCMCSGAPLGRDQIRQIIKLLEPLKSTLIKLILSTTDEDADAYFETPLELNGFTALESLTIEVDAEELVFTNCPQLVAIYASNPRYPLKKIQFDKTPEKLKELHYKVGSTVDPEPIDEAGLAILEQFMRDKPKEIEHVLDGEMPAHDAITRDIEIVLPPLQEW